MQEKATWNNEHLARQSSHSEKMQSGGGFVNSLMSIRGGRRPVSAPVLTSVCFDNLKLLRMPEPRIVRAKTPCRTVAQKLPSYVDGLAGMMWNMS